MIARAAVLLMIGVALATGTARAQSCPAIPDNLLIDYTCPDTCISGEEIWFRAVPVPSPIPACWDVQWSSFFRAAGPTVRTTVPGAGTYTITLTVTALNGTRRTVQRNITFTAGNGVPPYVQLAIPTPRAIANEPVVFVGSAITTTPIRGWEWDFGDGSPREKGADLKTVSHVYRASGSYKVVAYAANAVAIGKSERTLVVAPQAPQAFTVTIPVVSHIPGVNDSFWQTDLHLFTPPPAAVPIELELEFGNARKTLVVDTSTRVANDILSTVTSAGGAGILRISGKAVVPPQIWSRTYNLSQGGTFGQFIPAVGIAGSAAETPNAVPLVVGGLEDNDRFRTNLGLANLAEHATEVEVTILGRGEQPAVTVAVPPRALVQTNLKALFPAAAGPAPFGLRLKTADMRTLYAYASMIDAVTNDPTFIAAIPEARLSRNGSLVPGMGRTGAWRSDLLLFNPSTEKIELSLWYVNDRGSVVAITPEISLEPGQSTVIRDIGANPLFSPRLENNPIGAIQMRLGYSDLVFAVGRTYNQQARGTFGQGIPSVDPATPNVQPLQKAVIAGVLENGEAYANLGLMSVDSFHPSVVAVTLLDERDGSPRGTRQFELTGGQSIIIGPIVSMLNSASRGGTLQLELLSGGAVWAYASLIDRRTRDPEYVPAIPLP